jgi:hypothetical protein
VVGKRLAADFLCLYNADMDTPTRGRPPKAETDRRTIRFQIRVTPRELEALERAAKGKTSTWARRVLLDAAKRKA